MNAEFVDTNVLVYAHDTSAGAKREVAAELLGRLFDSGAGRLSMQVLIEFYVTATSKLPRTLGRRAARSIVEDFGTWPVFRPAVEDLLEAAMIAERYDIAMWDALIVRAAEAMGAELIWSEDLNHGQDYRGVEVRNPFR